MADSRDPDSAKLASEDFRALVRTALYDTGGEMVEGGFVDRWESNAANAIGELDDALRPRGLNPEEAAILLEELRAPEVPFEAAVRLLTGLRTDLRTVLEPLAADASAHARSIAGAVQGTLRADGELPTGLTDSDPEVRRATLVGLRGPREEVQAAIRSALDDPESSVRAAAAAMIRFYGDPEGQRAALERLSAEPDAAVRKAILLHFAEETRRAGIHVGPDKVRAGIGDGVLLAMFGALGHEDKEVREKTASAMERLRGEDVASAMLERLKVEADFDVRMALVRFNGYAAIADRAFPVLVDVFRNDPDQSVRVWTGFLFETFGPRAEPVLLEALASEEQAIHRPAVMSLGKVGTIRSLPALTRELAAATDTWYVREIDIAITDVVITDAHAEQRAWPADAPARVQALIDALNPKEPGEWPALVCKRDLNALPLWGRGIDLWALRPDGAIHCLDLDSVRHETWVEDDPLVRFAAMAHGAETYPELADLIPNPPKDARPCSICLTQGFANDERGEQPICMACSGRGWVLRAPSQSA